MMSQAHLGQPPRLAVWFINLFTAHQNAESIFGDLLEEYSYLASKSGVPFARRWYCRQTVKTIAHLGSGYRAAPWSITAAAVGGFLLHRFVSGLPDRLLSAVTDRDLAFWSTHFNAYIWALKAMMPVRLVASRFVGCVIALAVKGRGDGRHDNPGSRLVLVDWICDGIACEVFASGYCVDAMVIR
jgi:hypothetical protein